MGIEAFVWPFENRDHAALPVAGILTAFELFTRNFDQEAGLLSIDFDQANSCDIHLGTNAVETGLTKGLTICRPVRDHRLWQCILEFMRQGNVILFFSDDTTPLYATPDAPNHFPKDLIESLGAPRLVASPDDIVRSHEG